MELNKPLYGLCDDGEYWGVTTEKHIVNYLEITPVIEDPSLNIKVSKEKLIGIPGKYVDDSLNAGSFVFGKKTEKRSRSLTQNPKSTTTFSLRSKSKRSDTLLSQSINNIIVPVSF